MEVLFLVLESEAPCEGVSRAPTVRALGDNVLAVLLSPG